MVDMPVVHGRIAWTRASVLKSVVVAVCSVDFFRETERGLQHSRPGGLSPAAIWVYRALNLPLNALNGFWFYRMLTGALKVLKQSSVNEHKSLEQKSRWCCTTILSDSQALSTYVQLYALLLLFLDSKRVRYCLNIDMLHCCYVQVLLGSFVAYSLTVTASWGCVSWTCEQTMSSL